MIVEITSWAPDGRLQEARRCPPRARRRARRRWPRGGCAGAGSCPLNDEPIQTAKTAPTMYWPWPPMLNRPQRNANATARPVRISVVVMISVCCRLQRRGHALVARDPREEPVEPGAVEDRPVGRERVLARRDEHDEAADEEREQRRQHRREQAPRLLRDVVAPEERLLDLGPEPRRVGGRALGRRARSSRRRSLTPPPRVRGRRRSSRCRAAPRVAVGGNSPTISPS